MVFFSKRRFITLTLITSRGFHCNFIPRGHDGCHRLLAGLLQTRPQVRGLCVLVRKLAQVLLQAWAEGVIADVPVQHADNRSALEKNTEIINLRKLLVKIDLVVLTAFKITLI
jgi:hypothetical protein